MMFVARAVQILGTSLEVARDFCKDAADTDHMPAMSQRIVEILLDGALAGPPLQV